MNRQIFQQIEAFAESMMKAAETDNEKKFYSVYAELEALAEQYKGKKNDHPVFWETLADFSEENQDAIKLYQQAYQLADSLKDTEYKASIQYSLAQRLFEEGQKEDALEALAKAEKFAGFTEDQELQEDIQQLRSEIE
ncbi:tetratricopeptide repeat protein [Neptuniibacter sp. QD72_48]|uniref:tetratricopeptide repeat protein n=1 Tax=unclassified Neptuniibacter TaxID=2630693 RepID=UPI0039F63953